MRTIYRETNGTIVKETAPLPKRGSQFQEMNGTNMLENYAGAEAQYGSSFQPMHSVDQVRQAWEGHNGD